jgi:hypothetical protein
MNQKSGVDRRELEPINTRGYMHVPHLREKLGWLYGYHPFIKTQYMLADELHVAPATLSTWLNGTRYTDTKTIATTNPDSIPTKHFRSFVDLWGLPAAVLEIEDMAEFRNALATFESGRSPWEKLVRSLPDDKTIDIVVNGKRGLIDPDDEEDKGIIHLRSGDGLLLRVPNPGLRHGALLMEDRLGWSCLRPNPRWIETAVRTELVFPRQLGDGVPRFATLDSVGGIHRIVAIFADEAFPSGVTDILMSRPMDVGGLNHTVAVFQSRLAAGPNKCRMFGRRFLVTDAPRSGSQIGGKGRSGASSTTT